jgi:2-hydroxyacylsphingosine 1-beta-galactosyltransferase
MALLAALLALLCVGSVVGDKIFGVAYPGGHSHQLILAKIGRELVSRGHEFFYIHSSLDALNHNNFTSLNVLTYEAPMSSDEWDAVSPQIVDLNPTEGVMLIFKLQETFCKAIMAQTAILDKVRGSRAMVADVTFMCSVLIADYLDIPVRVDFSATGVADPLFTTPYGVISPTAYHPMAGSRLGRPNGFLERLKNNIFYYVDTQIVMKLYALPWVNEMRKQYNLVGTHQEFQHAKGGILLAQSTWGLEFPHPITPAIKVVGPILPSAGKPLPADLEAFIASSDQGFILVSMGTILFLSESIIQRLKAALVQLPYNIIWKLNMDIGELPSNIRTMKWIPQNDLLAHPKIKMFISHGGLNGVQEAGYHGVPMVGFPLFADQFENLIRVRDRGFGVIVDRDDFSPETLSAAVTDVFTSSKYLENAQKIKKIVRDSPEATPECADWVEFAMRQDGALFNVVPNDLEWWQLANLDVFAFLLGFVAVIVLVVFAILRKLISMIKLALESKNKKE